MLAMALALAVLAWGRWRDSARRRAEAYAPAIRSAVELLQVAALGRRADAWEPLLMDLRGSVLGRGHSGAERGATRSDPAAAAVRILDDASRLQPEKPETYYYLAKGLLLLGDQAAAARELERAARADPGFVPALVLRASLLKRLKDNPAAAALEREVEARVHGGWAETWLLARRLLREGRWKEAIDASSRLITSDLQDGEPYVGAAMEARLLRAAARLEDEDVGQALQDLAVVRHLWPTALEPALLEAKAFRLLGREDIAERLLAGLHAAAVFKDDVALGIIAVYAVSSTRDEAKALEWAEKLSPGFLKEWNRAESLAALGRDEEAVQAGRAALECEPDHPDARGTLALTLYERLGRYDEALAVLDAGIERHPASALLHYHRGCLHFRWGKLEEAAASFREAVRLDPRGARPRADLGLTLVRSGECPPGLAALAEATALDPGLSYGHNNLGLALSWMGRLDEARAALDQAARLDPGWSWPHWNRAAVRERQGRWAEAIADYQNACERIPKSQGACAGLARLLAREGRHEEALEVCASGLEMFPAAAGLHRELTAILLGGSLTVGPTQVERLHRALVRSPGIPGEVNRTALALLACDSMPAAADSLLPPSPGYAALDMVLGTGKVPPIEKARRLLMLFSQGAGASDPATHVLYLEGRCSQLSGRLSEAAKRFSALVVADPTASEPVLRLAECLRALGDPERAAAHLQDALEGHADSDSRLLVLWAGIQFAELGRPAAELLLDLPLLAGELGPDLRWLVERLAREEPISIDCGGSGCGSRDGTVWAGDRFFAGGETGISLALQIGGTEDDLLYQTERWFPAGGVPRGGYRVPLPPGEYRVILHFAETWFMARGFRSFAVLLEGEEVLSGHEPLAAGFAAAHLVPLAVAVEDGILDLEFLPRTGDPQVSGIEIRRDD
jgi:tetratricopeptide (TPR) repeat protein